MRSRMQIVYVCMYNNNSMRVCDDNGDDDDDVVEKILSVRDVHTKYASAVCIPNEYGFRRKHKQKNEREKKT